MLRPRSTPFKFVGDVALHEVTFPLAEGKTQTCTVAQALVFEKAPGKFVLQLDASVLAPMWLRISMVSSGRVNFRVSLPEGKRVREQLEFVDSVWGVPTECSVNLSHSTMLYGTTKIEVAVECAPVQTVIVVVGTSASPSTALALAAGAFTPIKEMRVEHDGAVAAKIRSASYLLVSAITLFLGLVYLNLQMPEKGGNFSIFEIATATLVSAGALFGIEKLPTLPALKIVRRIVYFEYAMPWRAWTALVLFGAVASWLSVPQLGIVMVRDHYVSLIDESLDASAYSQLQVEKACEAFRLVPERIEAQVIIEQAAAHYRAHGVPAHRKFVDGIVSDPRIWEMLKRWQMTEAFGVAGRVTNQPRIWFATFAPEAEDHGTTAIKQRSVSLLAQDASPFAQIVLQLLRLEINGGRTEAERKAQAQAAADLKKQTETIGGNYTPKEAITMQLAYDRLAQWSVYEGAYDDCLAYFTQELSARARIKSGSGIPMWPSPPAKLILYNLFMRLSPTDKFPAYSAVGADNFLARAGFQKAFVEKFIPRNSSWLNPEQWNITEFSLLKAENVEQLRNSSKTLWNL